MYSAALSPLVNFHRMAAITRIFTAICRLLGDSERVLFLSCDLLRRPLTSAELPVITGMAGVWPIVFSRRPELPVVLSGRLNTVGIEAQPLSYALEVVITVMISQGGLSQHHITKLHNLCKWSSGQVSNNVCVMCYLSPPPPPLCVSCAISHLPPSLVRVMYYISPHPPSLPLSLSQTISMKLVDKLSLVLLQVLQTSRKVTVEQQLCQGWSRPRPSHLTFHLVHALRLLSWFKGWVWTSDVLIKAHIWPILQAWNSKKDSVAEATVMAVVRLLGEPSFVYIL